MRRIACITLFIAAMLPLYGQETGRILVAGFDIPGAGVIERRYLREEVMRCLVSAGAAVVPVMEMEEQVLGDDPMGVFPPDEEKTVMRWAERIDASVVISGSCERKGESWVVRLLIYGRDDRRFTRYEFEAPGTSYPDPGALAHEILTRIPSRVSGSPSTR